MLSDRILQLGLGRTGGSLFRYVLRNIPGHRLITDAPHSPYDYFVELCKEEKIAIPPVVTFVRNPWSWYVATWCWNLQIKYCPIKGQGPWLGSFREFLEVVHEHAIDNWNFYTQASAWTYLQCDKAEYVGRFENLYDEYVRILLTIMPDLVSEALIRKIIKTNEWYGCARCPDGQRDDHQTLDHRKFYDAEDRLWVAKWDAEIIEKHHYEF